jgi:hypothetical protein
MVVVTTKGKKGKRKRISAAEKEQRNLFPVLPITFYSGPTKTEYTITDPNDPLVASKQQLKNERDKDEVEFEVEDLVFVFYDKHGSCRPGRVTNKKSVLVRVRSKGKMYKVEKFRYTVEAIEHTEAMGKDSEGQLWTLFHVTGKGKQPGSKSGEHLATSLVALKPGVIYYITKKDITKEV